MALGRRVSPPGNLEKYLDVSSALLNVAILFPSASFLNDLFGDSQGLLLTVLTFCGRIPGELELEILGPDPSLNCMLYHDSDYCVHSFESDRLVRALVRNG